VFFDIPIYGTCLVCSIHCIQCITKRVQRHCHLASKALHKQTRLAPSVAILTSNGVRNLSESRLPALLASHTATKQQHMAVLQYMLHTRTRAKVVKAAELHPRQCETKVVMGPWATWACWAPWALWAPWPLWTPVGANRNKQGKVPYEPLNYKGRCTLKDRFIPLGQCDCAVWPVAQGGGHKGEQRDTRQSQRIHISMHTYVFNIHMYAYTSHLPLILHQPA